MMLERQGFWGGRLSIGEGGRDRKKGKTA